MIKAFTWGTFNYLHDAHRILLNEIRSICDELHVILIPGEEVFKNKGYFPLDNIKRMDNLKKIKTTDFIHLDSYNMGLKSLIKYKPDVFILGYDQKTEWEKKLFSYIHKNHLPTKIYYLTKFANGVHSARFR